MTTISDFVLNKLYTLPEFVMRAGRTKPLTCLLNGKGRRYIDDDGFLLDIEEPYTLHENSYPIPIKNAALVEILSIKGRRKILPLSIYRGCDSFY